MASGRGSGGKNVSKGGGGRKKSQNAPWICVKCDEPVVKNDEVIECFGCKEWCHRACTELTDEQYRCCRDGGASIQWLCEGCKDMKNPVSEIKSRMEVQLDKILTALESVTERLEKLERIQSADIIEKKIEVVVEQKVAEYMDEMREKEKRKLNIIVANLSESEKDTAEGRKEEDLERVRTMVGRIADVPADHLLEPVRLGKLTIGRNARPRLLKLEVRTEESKREIMKNVYNLNKTVANAKDRIYINNDSTPKEREQMKQLKQELKMKKDAGENDWVINYRDMKLVKRSVLPGRGSAGAAEASASTEH